MPTRRRQPLISRDRSAKALSVAESRTEAPRGKRVHDSEHRLRVRYWPTSSTRYGLQLVWYPLLVILRAGIGSVLY